MPVPRSGTEADPVANATAALSCPLCAGRQHQSVRRVEASHTGVEGTFELRRCDDCELVFVSPRLDDQRLAKLYDEAFYFPQDSAFRGIAAGVQELIQDARRHVVEKRSTVGRLLDLGSGDGSFVHHMASHGWDATGIDLSPTARELALRRGLQGHYLQGTLFEQDLPEASLDVVTLWQVLEHIGEPLPLLCRVRDLLRAGQVRDAAELLGRPYALDGRVVRGEGSAIMDRDAWLHVATSVQRGQFAEVKDAWHHVILDDPAAFCSIVTTWLDRAVPGAATQ